MFAYRHAYHAGNYADVLKHSILAYCLEYMTQKTKPVFYLDTHAGAGTYDLRSTMAQKKKEFSEGVGALYDHDEQALIPEAYQRALDAVNPNGKLEFYPGSPTIAQYLLRDDDPMHLCELHNTVFELAKEEFSGRPKTAVKKEDGFSALNAYLPPASRRALVMMDPPYEDKSDYSKATAALLRGYAKFPGGVYLLWYPVVQRHRIEEMAQRLVQGIETKLWQVEWAKNEDRDEFGMDASGLFMVNPPYTLPAFLEEWMPKAAEVLGLHAFGLQQLSTS